MPKAFQELRAVVVALDTEDVGMSGAIKFDNDATFRTIKVGNVRTYAVLAPEFLSVQLALPQASPQ